MNILAAFVNGGTISQRPGLGEELTVLTRGGDSVNIGQVKEASYESGDGSGFIVKATRIKEDASVYLKLANSRLRVPLLWS